MKKIIVIILVLWLTVPAKAVNKPVKFQFYPMRDGHFVLNAKTPTQYLAGFIGIVCLVLAVRCSHYRLKTMIRIWNFLKGYIKK
jgi:hypothetical protein